MENFFLKMHFFNTFRGGCFSLLASLNKQRRFLSYRSLSRCEPHSKRSGYLLHKSTLCGVVFNPQNGTTAEYTVNV